MTTAVTVRHVGLTNSCFLLVVTLQTSSSTSFVKRIAKILRDDHVLIFIRVIACA